MMMMRKVSRRRDWWFGEHTDDKHYTLGHLGKTVKFPDRYLLAHFEHFASYRAAVTVVVGARCHASRLSVWVTAGDDAAGVSAVFVDTVMDLHSGRRTSCDLSCSLPLLGNLVSRTCGLSPAVDASWSSIMPVSLWRIAAIQFVLRRCMVYTSRRSDGPTRRPADVFTAAELTFTNDTALCTHASDVLLELGY